MDINLTAADQDKKRKQKEEKRRKIKEERKNKIKDHAFQKNIQQTKKSHEFMIDKKKRETYKEQLNDELISQMNIAEKIGLMKSISNEIIQNPDEKYRKLNDLLLLCKDPKDIDVVIKALKTLCDVYCDILPSYRIRQQNTEKSEDGKENAQKGGQKVSKEVSQLREQEQFLLQSYKDYLKILEVFSKTNADKLIKKQGINQDSVKKKAFEIYRKLREQSFVAFCKLLKRHPHFNFRLNILQIIMPRLSTNEMFIRNECTALVFDLLKRDEYSILDFKLEILKELAKVIKQRPHFKMDPNLLDCLVSHKIIVDEEKAKIIDASSKKVEDLHQQLGKLRKKGKYNDYREMKQDLIKEMKESDGIGLDLGQSTKLNNLIIKEILAIYFNILKNKSDSPLLKGVFLGLPQFTSFVNVEIVWDLINVMREYFLLELEENEEDNEKKPLQQKINEVKLKSRQANLSNVLTGLLCAFQIIDIGSGTAFAVEEKDFIDALYQVIYRMFEHPFNYQMTDFLAFLKCMTIVFLQRRQYSNDLVNAFVKRLASVQIHLPLVEQSGILYLIKQIITKYPSAKSSLLEADSEGLTSAFQTSVYRPDINDPQLSNASQSSITLELIQTVSQYRNKNDNSAFKLAKSILMNDQMPQEFLGLHSIQVVKNLSRKINTQQMN